MATVFEMTVAEAIYTPTVRFKYIGLPKKGFAQTFNKDKPSNPGLLSIPNQHRKQEN